MKRQSQYLELTAMLLIGDGVLGVLYPSAHCAVWQNGSPSWNAAMDWFAARPSLVRVLASVELAIGLGLVDRRLHRLETSTPSIASSASDPVATG